MELRQSATMSSGFANDQICEKCGRDMTLLATLPQMGHRPCVRVYKCLPCRRIDTVEDAS